MIDFNGTYEYSNIISINYLGEKELSIFPDPIHNKNLIVNGLEKDERIKLFRINGSLINFDFIDGNIQIKSNNLNSAEMILLKSSFGKTAKTIIE
jgi:hypothetical protein